MNATSKISVDLLRPNTGTVVHAIAGDGPARQVRVLLLADGQPWEPPEGVETAVSYLLPTMHKGLYNLLPDGTPAVSVTGNAAEVILAPQMLTQQGTVRVALMFHDPALDRLTAFPFTLWVAGTPAMTDQQTENYIRLQWLEDRMAEWIQRAEDALGGLPGTGGGATLVSQSVTYQAGDSGTVVPSGVWTSSVPVVADGKYLWTKTELQFNTGEPIVSYSVSRMGQDGGGSQITVNGIAPDETGNIAVTASDVGALPVAGGDITGEIRMNGQPISGLSTPTEETQAANKGYVDQIASGKLEMVLLWENASPASAFAAQNVTHAAFGNYEAYPLLFIKSNYFTGIFKNAESVNSVMSYSVVYPSTSRALHNARLVYIRAGLINFGDNGEFICTSGTNSFNTANGNNIPHKIYGIRGVSV